MEILSTARLQCLSQTRNRKQKGVDGARKSPKSFWIDIHVGKISIKWFQTEWSSCFYFALEFETKRFVNSN